MPKNKKIGLALGGGGARGLAHLGVLKVLRREGIKIDYICGVSMGSIIGALFALGLDLDEIEKEILKYNRKTKLIRMADIRFFSKNSMLKGVKPYKFIEQFINAEAVFSDAKVPFTIVATDLNTGDEAVLKRGNILEAVKASSCVPGIFPPVKIGTDYYIDGGVVNPTPVDVTKEMGADIVIAVDLIVRKKVEITKPNIFNTLMRSYDIIRAQAVKFKMSQIGDAMILIEPNIGGIVDSFKFDNMDRFIKAGEEATEEMLPEILKKLGRLG
ncbi:MAG: patatin-like phospholipase family protein [Candidatus Magasanikbacteria bacterium]|nr:patatin-like phospholipase family protein [Candidatus Magasanikbacteria bacterium]